MINRYFLFISLCSIVLVSLNAKVSVAADDSLRVLRNVTAKKNKNSIFVDLFFEKNILAKTIKPGFERNFVQFVLRDTKMNAARMLPISESELVKVFAYPYSQDVARVRLILKREHQWAKGRIEVQNLNSKTLRVILKTTAQTKGDENVITNEDHDLIKEVQKNTNAIDIHDPESVKSAFHDVSDEKQDLVTEKNQQELKTNPSAGAGISGGVASTALSAVEKKEAKSAEQIGVKSDPSRHFLRMALALFAVLGLFVGCVFLLKRYSANLKKLPFGKKERLIQVVATQYLGNKKSISLVKVTGEYMVIGVGNDGISLLSKLGSEVNVDKYLEDRFWGGTFEKHLSSYANDPKVAKELDFSSESKLDQKLSEPLIEDKVVLSPVRASIKEKLTKLKPLV